MITKATKEAYQLFHDGSIALSQIEANGLRIDESYLKHKIEETKAKIKEIEAQMAETETFKVWRKTFWNEMNLDSPDQLAHILYDKMGHPCHAWTSGGASGNKKRKTDQSAIELIGSDFSVLLLQRAKMATVLAKLKEIKRETVNGYAHCSYNFNTAVSYRGSCSDFNFQNLPVRNPEMAGNVRPAFIPRGEDRVIVENDFVGIEVKVSACYNKDPRLIEYIKDKTKDMHRDMAAQVYMIEPHEVGKVSRYCAKNMFVFPQFYGSYWADCARNLWVALDRMNLTLPDGSSLKGHLEAKGIHRLGDGDPDKEPKKGTFERHIKEVEEDFWGNRFSVYTAWKKAWWKSYLQTGGFMLKTGFYVSGLMKRNEVLNYAVQGSAFHCLVKAIIKIQRWLVKRKMKTVLIGQIHDSLIADVHLDELGEYLAYVKYVMTEWLPKQWKWIIVPLEVEAEISPPGQTWHDKKVTPINFDQPYTSWKKEALESSKACKMSWPDYKKFLRSINYPIPIGA